MKQASSNSNGSISSINSSSSGGGGGGGGVGSVNNNINNINNNNNTASSIGGGIGGGSGSGSGSIHSHSNINIINNSNSSGSSGSNNIAGSPSQKSNSRQTLPREFSPVQKQPPMYNPPPPFSPLKPTQNGFAQSMKLNVSAGSVNLMQFTPSRPQSTSGQPSQPSGTARSLLPQLNETTINTQLGPGPAAYPSGASPPLSGASQQLVMSLNDEFRASKVMKVRQEAQDASQQEALVALQATGWDVNQAAKQIAKDRLAKVETLLR
jgi:activated CDC42 kinase 1